MRKSPKENPYKFDIGQYVTGGSLFAPNKADPMGMYDFGKTDTNQLPQQTLGENRPDLGINVPQQQPEQPMGGGMDLGIINHDTLKSFDKPGILDQVPGHLLYVFNNLGQKTNYNDTIQNYYERFKGGDTLDNILSEEEKTKLESLNKVAADIAAQSAHLPRDEFNALMAKLQGEMGKQVGAPQRPDLKNPNIYQGLAAGLGALVAPNHAFEIAATPFQEGLRKQEQGYQDDKLRYDVQSHDRDQNIQELRQQLNIQDSSDRAAMSADEQRLDRQYRQAQGEASQYQQQIMGDQRIQGKLSEIDRKNAQADQDKNTKAYYEGKDLFTKHSAWEALGGTYSGLKEPTERTADEQMKLSHAEKYQADATKVNEMLPLQKTYLQSKIKLDDNRAAKLAKETWWMDKEKAVNVAKGYAAIDNIKSMMSDRTFKQNISQQRLALDAWAKSSTSLTGALTSLSAQGNGIRQRRGILEGKLANKNISKSQADALRESIKNYDGQLAEVQRQYGAIKAEQAEVRDTLRSIPQEQKGVSNDHIMLRRWVEGIGFTVTDGYATSGHNPNSPHYRGLAVDVRTRDKSEAEVNDFIATAKRAGIRVLDERGGPYAPGAVWSGPHLHLQFDSPGKAVVRENDTPKQTKRWWESNKGQTPSTQNKAKSGKQSVNVPGVGNVTYRRG